MNKLFILPILFVSLHSFAAIDGEVIMIANKETGEKITHIREIYKSVDTFRLKADIFYSNQSLTKENNTAIVFFHGGGWAFGTPDEFFTTCERYAKMGIVTFSIEYRLSVENGVTPHKTISPIECVIDAKSAIRWVRENARKFHIDSPKIIAAGQSAGGHLALCTAMIHNYNEISDNMAISCRPDAILLFSSCINAVEGWCDRLLADRRDKIWSISPAHNIKKGVASDD
ncbi:MAG: alpha/beta hydrolase fold domain-containing protein [Bacteroidales bacterium]|nr:alpha/beta hydrolase fold domain-containing protein [Bacteroidales bacterium]